MHVVIINGSPRAEQFSNTDKIIDSFAGGILAEGSTFEKYAISNRNNWEEAREAYVKNTEIIFALPLYVENAPGLLLEFLGTLPLKDKNTRISFILQSGFAEAGQLRCGEAFLEKLPDYLGTSFGGILIKGDNFGIRVVKEDEAAGITGPYREMGRAFVSEDGFNQQTVSKFAGPEYYSFPIRLLLQIIFKTMAKKRFEAVAREWGSKEALDYRPW